MIELYIGNKNTNMQYFRNMINAINNLCRRKLVRLFINRNNLSNDAVLLYNNKKYMNTDAVEILNQLKQNYISGNIPDIPKKFNPNEPQKRRILPNYNGEHEQRMPSGAFGRNNLMILNDQSINNPNNNNPNNYPNNHPNNNHPINDRNPSIDYSNLNQNFENHNQNNVVNPININKFEIGNLNDNQLWNNNITEQEQKLIDELRTSKKNELDLDKYQMMRNAKRH
jgi:hypothetical protein